MNPTYNKRDARYCVHLFLFVGESIKYEEISLFGRVINSTYKQWSIVLRFDDKQERTVQREGVFFHLNRHAHLHNIHLGVGSSLTAVFINFDMGLLFHVGNSDIAVSDTGQVCTSIKKLFQAECFAGVIQVKFGVVAELRNTDSDIGIVGAFFGRICQNLLEGLFVEQ